MAVTLTINGQSIEAVGGGSLFDYAETLGIDVPTSCR
jgi:NADH dehydrogenase/NADH:ubiquinone oxidoreductase subunit G